MIADRGNFRHIAYAFKTDVGKKRKNNEDSLGAFPEGGLFCVADGMGGGDDGEIASAAVAKAARDVAQRCADGAGHSAKDVAGVLEAGLSDASAWICRRASAKKMGVCGSTFVGVVFDSTAPSKALAIHAGDSRLYLVRGKSVRQITRDHSASEMMGEKDESKVNPLFRSMIVNAVGIRRIVECERTPFKVAAGDRVLVCSDGLYRMVPDRRIGEISAANEDVEKAVDELVAAALEGGGVDNVSVVLCEIGKLPKALAAAPIPETPCADAAETRGTGEDADSDAPDAEVTRQTMVPLFEDPPDPVETPAGDNPRPGSSDSPTVRAHAPRRRLPIFALLAAGCAMLVAAAIVLFVRSESDANDMDAVVASDAVPTNAAASSRPPYRHEDCTNPPLVTVRTDVMTNVPIVEMPEPKPPAPKPPAPKPPAPKASVPVAEAPANATAVATPTKPLVPVATNRTVVAPMTNRPSVKVTEAVCPALVAACEAKSVAGFAEALRRLNGEADSSREFDEQVRRFRESAKQCARMRSGKFAANAVIDLKYVLAAAEAAKERLEGASAERAICRFVDDWVLVSAGSEKDVRVQEAGARLILNAPQLKVK